jgi:uncharacterized protein with HEPN domain
MLNDRERRILIIENIIEHANKIAVFLKELNYSKEAFERDIKSDDSSLSDGLTFRLALIGEEMGRLGDNGEFANEHPSLLFREARIMRNRIMHDYAKAGYERVWLAITKSVPELRENLVKVLSEEYGLPQT